MLAMFPCDLGDGIEVVHDVETIEVEMECDVDDHAELTARFTYQLDLHEAQTVPYPKN